MNTIELNKFIIKYSQTIHDAMCFINDNSREIVFVVDEDCKVIGSITDGDIRRGLLAGYDLNSLVSHVMNTNYICVSDDMDRATVLDLMKAHSIRQVPVLSNSKKLLGIHFFNDLIGASIKSNIAVIMAGGKGVRLRPLTENCPKPMIKVAGRPILERVILHLMGHGIRTIYISINYLGNMIEEYFGDGSKFGCKIKYLREEKPLGTGGALSLFEEIPVDPFIVMNGDLITQVNISKLLEFHVCEGVEATIAGRQYKVDIPFGVMTIGNNRLVNLQEKPSSHYMINSGIYVFNPSVLSFIPQTTEYPITSLFDFMLDHGKQIGVYMLDEEWIDVGRHEELNKANGI